MDKVVTEKKEPRLRRRYIQNPIAKPPKSAKSADGPAYGPVSGRIERSAEHLQRESERLTAMAEQLIEAVDRHLDDVDADPRTQRLFRARAQRTQASLSQAALSLTGIVQQLKRANRSWQRQL